eukprot:jgi/Mesvir1/18083/Mv09384-RA.4
MEAPPGSSAMSRVGKVALLLAMIVVVAPALGCFALTPTGNGWCEDDSTLNVDENCTSTYPFCFGGSPKPENQQGNGIGIFNFCAACLDSEPGTGVDYGCPTYRPICFELHGVNGLFYNTTGGDIRGPSDGDFEEGINCTACLDTAPGAGTDLGCENAFSYGSFMISDGEDFLPAPICYTGGASDGSLMEGEALFFLGGSGNPGDANATCTVCLDSRDGTRRDLGCTSTKPFCFDVSFQDFTEMNETELQNAFLQGEWGNNGDNGFGWFCSDCYDSSYDGTDVGCNSETPHCLSLIHPPWGGASDLGTQLVGFDCAECNPSLGEGDLTEAGFGCPDDKPLCRPTRKPFVNVDPPEPFYIGLSQPKCFACVDNVDTGVNAVGTADYACSEGFPFCADLFTTTNPIGEAYEIPYGSFCAECIDDLEQASLISGFDPLTITEIDFSCNNTHPFCFDRNQTLGSGDFGLCTAYVNPACDFQPNSDGSLAHVPAVCVKELAVQVTIVLTLQNCFIVDFDLTPVAESLRSTFLAFIPACAIDTKLEKTSGNRRKLLQLPSATDFRLALEVFVDTVEDGDSVLDVINSPEFAQWLQDTFAISVAQAAQLVDLQAVFLLLGVGTSDPHFTTLAGDKFDFNGVADQNYCIVSDKQVQVNAHFMGAAAGNALASPEADARTWMDQLAIMHGSDRILIDAAAGANATYTTSLGNVVVNGEALVGRMAMKKLPSGITVSRKNTRMTVVVPGVVAVKVEVVRAAFWEAGAGPGKNFLNLQLMQFNATSAVHGVLGQSYAANSKTSVPEGRAADYVTSGIFAADCHFNQFVDAEGLA